ncbi:MAG: metal-dependent hydrolase [Oleiphilaceae bacterium]|nr:metal-dependent hydrolase [Oleiphilaceae bacterium]
MDPFAHTLFGAALAETGLKRTTRYATVTLLAGANLPDVDVIAHMAGTDASLYFRRGWSHGILALILLPLLLTGLVWLWHRWRSHPVGQASLSGGQAPPFNTGVILALSYLGVLSHLFLDWLNTYGVRLLMPFDGRWFYGDTLFIIDPWVWLLTGVGVVLAWSHRPAARAGWLLLAALASLLIITSELVTAPVKVLWLVGVVAVIGLRWRRPSRAFVQHLTRAGLATLVLYIGAVYGMARLAESTLAERYPEASVVQSNPVPGLPHAHRLILVEDRHYRIIQPDGRSQRVPRPEPDAVVRQALKDESIRGFANWTRHPYWEVDETERGWEVRFYDLRYVEPGKRARAGPDIAFARVEVLREEVQEDFAPARDQD